MSKNVNLEIGKKIKSYRKLKKITLKEMSKRIYKSISTISKYENGDIHIDVETLYNISKALDVSIDRLLYIEDDYTIDSDNKGIPSFFKNLSFFYSYAYDGRSGEIVKSRLNIMSKLDSNKYKINMYMNFKTLENYQVCENRYKGYIEHFDAKSNIVLVNEEHPMERALIQILASFLDSDKKWSMWTGFSTRPMMPVSSKLLLSKKPIKITKEFENYLKINKQDLRYLRLYNMFSIL